MASCRQPFRRLRVTYAATMPAFAVYFVIFARCLSARATRATLRQFRLRLEIAGFFTPLAAAATQLP